MAYTTIRAIEGEHPRDRGPFAKMLVGRPAGQRGVVITFLAVRVT
jgi:hypothetical protein